LPDGFFSANLLLEPAHSRATADRYEFFSLDYFISETGAVRHSRRWARNWIDTRG